MTAKKTTPAPAKRKAQPKTEDQPAKVLDFSANIESYFVIQKRLSALVPPELVFEKERGGKSFPFMNITDCTDLLDERAGIWQCSVTSSKQIGNDYVVVVRIEILAAEGWIAREDSGIEEINLNSYGDTASNAYAMAFKRAASKHGLGRELWRKHDYFASEPRDVTERRAARQAEFQNESNLPPSQNSGFANNVRKPPPQNPIARSLSDLLTGAQRGKIYGVAGDLGKDADAFVDNHLSCQVNELSKQAASWVIDNLPHLPVETRAAVENAPPSSGPPAPTNNVSSFPAKVYADDAPPASGAQINALQVTVDNLINKIGVDESVILAEFAAVGMSNAAFAASGEIPTENLTGERAGALITRFNQMSKNKN